MTLPRLVLTCASFILLGSSAVAAQPSPTGRRAATDSVPAVPSAGVYILVAVDDHALPYTLRHEGSPPIDVLASTLIVRPDGSFIQAMGYRLTAGGTSRFLAQPFSGRIRPEGDGLVARWDGAGLTPVSSARDTLVINNEGVRLQYLKRR